MVTALEIYNIGKRGQLSATNVIGFLIIVVLTASIMPTLTTFINITKAATGAETDILLDLIPLFLILGVIMTLFMYAKPHYAS